MGISDYLNQAQQRLQNSALQQQSCGLGAVFGGSLGNAIGIGGSILPSQHDAYRQYTGYNSSSTTDYTKFSTYITPSSSGTAIYINADGSVWGPNTTSPESKKPKKEPKKAGVSLREWLDDQVSEVAKMGRASLSWAT